MRTNLKIFRVKHDLTQKQVAEKIGCERTTYIRIEQGKTVGIPLFWGALKNAYGLSDEEISHLKINF